MPQAQPRGQTITVAQATALLGRSDRWVQGLVKAGYMDRAQRGEYTLVGVIRGKRFARTPWRGLQMHRGSWLEFERIRADPCVFTGDI